MRIGIVVKPGLTAARETLVDLEQRLRDRGVEAVWSTEAAALLASGPRTVVERHDLPARVDLAIVLGGDGTLLAMAKTIAESGHDIPILAVNFGSLGFLTEITRPEINESIDAVLNGRATHDQRMMLRAVATRAGQPTLTHMALTDVVFTRTALSRMIELSVSVGDQLVTTVKAEDGHCKALAWTKIAGVERAELISIYVKLSGALSVDYVDVKGRNPSTGEILSERLRH